MTPRKTGRRRSTFLALVDEVDRDASPPLRRRR